MILIADSGSTKTDWRLIKDKENVQTFKTIGFNPYFIKSDTISNELISNELFAVKNDVKHVFFYGAGCSNNENKEMIFNSLTNFFTNANIQIDHDMLAAARATSGKESGIIAILGTGSNSCLYDGKEIINNITSLGYLLGDNGSGADIGKTFIKAFLGKQLPIDIEADFNQKFKLTTEDILDAVYKKKFPNRFLAKFSLFVFQYINDPYIKKMVDQRFELFFEKNICKYSDYQNTKLNLVGSIAYVYQDNIKAVAKKYNIEIDKVIKQPIEELVQYHLD